MIERIIRNETMKALSNVGQSQPATHVHEMMIPGNLVARVIGKGGEVIKAMQEETGAKIVIIQESKEFAQEKLLKIAGPPDKVEFARVRVDQVIAEEQKKMGGGVGGGHMGGGRGRGGGGRGGWPNSGGVGGGPMG